MMTHSTGTGMVACRGGESRVLISTDVWARGLDVQQVSSQAAPLCAAYSSLVFG